MLETAPPPATGHLHEADLRQIDAPLSVRQAAVLLGLSYHCAYRAIIQGRLPARRVGHRYVTTRRDVEAYRASTTADLRPRKGRPARRGGEAPP